MQVEGVGIFCDHTGYWESYPEQLDGAVLSIESHGISAEQQDRSRQICSNWKEILAQCLAYIETRREDYGLEAKSFIGPGAFIQSGEEWCVYFDTDHAREAVVGVEFRGNQPFQLIVGD